MKDTILNLVATYTAAFDWFTWLLFAAALVLSSAAAWLIVAIGRRTFDAFAHANQVIADLDLDAHDPELAAGVQRLSDAINQTREEQP